DDGGRTGASGGGYVPKTSRRGHRSRRGGVYPARSARQVAAPRGGSMNDESWRRDEVRSPCVKLCVLHPVDRVCMGCFRTLDEIGRWSKMTPEERQAIMEALPARKPVQTRRGGRAGRIARGG